MEQEGRENRQVQPQRGAAAAQQQQQQQQPPHQKCPRCDSTNTKFCYFNNYSLSQPRHYCKTCKRYWTHGGTFRNIPIGGGSRKGKRATITKSSSSAISSLMSQTVRPGLLMRPSPSPPPLTMVHSSTSPYYNQLGGANVGAGVGVGGSGYLPSFPTFRSLNTSQPLNLSTTLPFSGFNAAPSLQPRFHQMGNGGLGSLYPPAQQGLIPSSTASQYPIQRPQSLINNGATTSSNYRASSHASLWNAPTINANSIMGNSNSGQNNVTGGSSSSSSSSLIPNHWLHLPGYGPPKQ